MINSIEEMEKYCSDKLFSEPQIEDCSFELGQKVMFINDYGLVFRDFKVIGFSKPDQELKGGHIHIDKGNGAGAYWFPHRDNELRKENDFTDLFAIRSEYKGIYYYLSKVNGSWSWSRDYRDIQLFSKKHTEIYQAKKHSLYDEDDRTLLEKAEYIPAIYVAASQWNLPEILPEIKEDDIDFRITLQKRNSVLGKKHFYVERSSLTGKKVYYVVLNNIEQYIGEDIERAREIYNKIGVQPFYMNS